MDGKNKWMALLFAWYKLTLVIGSTENLESFAVHGAVNVAVAGVFPCFSCALGHLQPLSQRLWLSHK